MELYVGQFCRKMGGAEAWRAKSGAAACHLCHRSHAWRFHRRRLMEPDRRIYKDADVQLLAIELTLFISMKSACENGSRGWSMALVFLRAGLGTENKKTHKDQLKRVCLVSVGANAKPLAYSRLGGEKISIAPHSVGAVPTAPGHAPTETSAMSHLPWRHHQ